MKQLFLTTALAMLCKAVPFNNETVETVTVKGKDGNALRINAADYNEKEHGKLLRVDAETPVQTVVPTLPELGGPTPTQKFVMPEGKKFVVVDATGTKIEHAEIDKAGYMTMEEAQEAIKKLPH